MKSLFTLLLCSFIPFLAVGCADGGGVTATAGAAVNAVCPIMGGKIDGKTNTDWNGKTIGFCCPPCIDEWNSMTDEERTAALAGESSGGHDHADHGDHDHGDHDSHDHGEATESDDASAASTEEPEESAEPAAE